MNKIKIYMDDERKCPNGFLLARNAYDCLELLEKNKGNVDILSLDHDLGERTMDGYDFVKKMVEKELYADEIYIHSANPAGRVNMYYYLINAIKHNALPSHIKVYL